MADKVHFLRPIRRPQVYRENIERSINFTDSFIRVSLLSMTMKTIKITKRRMNRRHGLELDLLDVDLFITLCVSHNKSYARRWSYWTSILQVAVISTFLRLHKVSACRAFLLTLSPKPHIRALIGCWTTSRLY